MSSFEGCSTSPELLTWRQSGSYWAWKHSIYIFMDRKALLFRLLSSL